MIFILSNIYFIYFYYKALFTFIVKIGILDLTIIIYAILSIKNFYFF